MPSPVGHALAAIAAGWMLSRPRPVGRSLIAQAGTLALIGMAPDLDLLVGRHSKETHSLGAALLIAAIAAWRRWPIAETSVRIFLAAFAAWLTHPILDALSFDKGPPIGVMLFWPVSGDHWHSGLAVFDAIERHWDRPGFVRQNVVAFLRELAILVPLAAMVWWLRRRR